MQQQVPERRLLVTLHININTIDTIRILRILGPETLAKDHPDHRNRPALLVEDIMVRQEAVAV